MTSALAEPESWSRCRLSLAPADGCQASRTTPRDRTTPGVGERQRGRSPASPCRVRPTGRRTTCSAERAGASADVDGDRQRHQPSQAHTVLSSGRSSTGPMPSSTSTGNRQLIEHQRGTGTDPNAVARTWPTATPVELGLGSQGQAVHQRAVCQRLHVVWSDEVTAVQPGPGPRRAQQGGRTARAHAQAQRRRLPGGPRDVDDVGQPRRRRSAPCATAAAPAWMCDTSATLPTPAAAMSCGSNPSA